MSITADSLPAKSTQSTTAGESEGCKYTRLHITPLDAELVSVVLPAALQPRARNISFHSIQTFPEKRYGFVDLPAMEADKLRKKLNGAVLKGAKMRIEPARPDDIPEPLREVDAEPDKDERKKNKKKRSKGEKESSSKKRKREAEEIAGIELAEGRKIKRGWTTADEPRRKDKKNKSEKDKKRKKETKSKYTDAPECLIKTKLPSTGAAGAIEDDTEPKKKRKKGKQKESVVHEFASTTRFPSFLKTSGESSKAGAAPHFVNGKGWVDEEGSVIEPDQTRPKPVAKARPQNTHIEPSPEEEDTTSSSGSSSESEEESASRSEAEAEVEAGTIPTKPKITPPSIVVDSPTSATLRPKSSGSTRSLTIKIPTHPETPASSKVHPLEALYKRPKVDGATTPSQPSAFSFFAAEADAQDDEDDLAGAPSQPPLTPFTREDMEWRNTRSAAPTPDTAHPNKTFTMWPRGDSHDIEEEDEEDEEDAEEDAPMEEAKATGAVEEDTGKGGEETTSDFQKWFWENRGDLNRSWKKRRKTVAKEKRYRENRARAERAI